MSGYGLFLVTIFLITSYNSLHIPGIEQPATYGRRAVSYIWGRRSSSSGKAITVSTIGAVTAAAGVQTARQMGQVQLAVAGRLLRIADGQAQAALELIEAASEGMADAMGEINRQIGQMLDTHA